MFVYPKQVTANNLGCPACVFCCWKSHDSSQRVCRPFGLVDLGFQHPCLKTHAHTRYNSPLNLKPCLTQLANQCQILVTVARRSQLALSKRAPKSGCAPECSHQHVPKCVTHRAPKRAPKRQTLENRTFGNFAERPHRGLDGSAGIDYGAPLGAHFGHTACGTNWGTTGTHSGHRDRVKPWKTLFGSERPHIQSSLPLWDMCTLSHDSQSSSTHAPSTWHNTKNLEICIFTHNVCISLGWFVFGGQTRGITIPDVERVARLIYVGSAHVSALTTVKVSLGEDSIAFWFDDLSPGQHSKYLQ